MATSSFAERTDSDGSLTLTVRYPGAAGRQRRTSSRERMQVKRWSVAREFASRLRVQLAEGDHRVLEVPQGR